MVNADSFRGKVLYLAEDFDEVPGRGGAMEFLPCAEEGELLTEFWEVAQHYDSIITFNGRRL